MNEKEQYHLGLLKRFAINGIDSEIKLALTLELDENEVETLYNIFDTFSEKQTFTYRELEDELKDKLNLNYQNLKVILNTFYDNEQYLDVITQYLIDNKNQMPGLSVEYHRIARELNI